MSTLDTLRNHVRQEFESYVNNHIPIRIIQCDDTRRLKLVGRREVREYFQRHLDQLELGEPAGAELHAQRAHVKDLVRKTVRYAILSHRWSDHEVTFHDFGRIWFFKPAGWTKVARFCAEAARQGMRFAWIDTCCIDKASSAELDESIRSMFKWYRNSALCIIHLSQTASLDDMAGDDWFRRGWTLQELLAPEKVQFFNRSWDRKSDKSQDDERRVTDIALCVASEVTGIPLEDLERFHPSPRYVDKRMKWAANREVTRVEDVAYSLMGIFNVSISAAYGEGFDRAFCRLVEAIMISGGDPSILNWAGHSAQHFTTRCMPASPASYLNQPKIHPSAYGLQADMALTSKGLRHSIVIIPLILSKVREGGYTFSFTNGSLPMVELNVKLLENIGLRSIRVMRSYAFGATIYTLTKDPHS
ncbi:HET-domain-containing protein, partial [Coniophora puteana RWD-64-598 SS2]